MAAQVQNSTSVDQPNSPAPKAEGKVGSLMKKMPKLGKSNTLYMILGVVVVALLGVASGWALSGSSKGGLGKPGSDSAVAPGAQESLTEAGIEDETAFPDTAEGILRKGGVDGEGTHHLERGVGPSQYAYLTSTVIDLESFVDKEVQVWGETIASQNAPWLMDVGKIKVIEK